METTELGVVGHTKVCMCIPLVLPVFGYVYSRNFAPPTPEYDGQDTPTSTGVPRDSPAAEWMVSSWGNCFVLVASIFVLLIFVN